MNALEILEHGDQVLRQSVDGLPEADWWPVREIIAHVATHEKLLVEFLESYLGEKPTAAGPLNGQLNGDGETRLADRSVEELWTEYEAAHRRSRALLARIARERTPISGTSSCYGPNCDLEDFLVYSYGHKQRHAAQIAVYRDQLSRMAALSI